MQARGTDFVMYEVSDLQRSAAFYRDILGLELAVFLPEYAWAELSAPPTTLALCDPRAHRPDAVVRPGGATLFLAVSDLVATVAELEQRGVPVQVPPVETPVCWMAVVSDPDGNAVGLHERKDGTCG